MTRLYSRTHEWFEAANGNARIGLSRFAADEIGEVAHVQLPEPGSQLQAGELLAEIESVKSIHEILAPVSGQVLRVNTALYADPTLLNREPEDGAWLLELSYDAQAATPDLLSQADYLALVQR